MADYVIAGDEGGSIYLLDEVLLPLAQMQLVQSPITALTITGDRVVYGGTLSGLLYRIPIDDNNHFVEVGNRFRRVVPAGLDTRIKFLALHTQGILVGFDQFVDLWDPLLNTLLREISLPYEVMVGLSMDSGHNILIGDIVGNCVVVYPDNDVSFQVVDPIPSRLNAMLYERDELPLIRPMAEFTLTGHECGECVLYLDISGSDQEAIVMVPRIHAVVGDGLCSDGTLPPSQIRFVTAGYRDGQFRTMFPADPDSDFGGVVGTDPVMTSFVVPFNGQMCYGGFQTGRISCVAQFQNFAQTRQVSNMPITSLALYEPPEYEPL